MNAQKINNDFVKLLRNSKMTSEETIKARRVRGELFKLLKDHLKEVKQIRKRMNTIDHAVGRK